MSKRPNLLTMDPLQAALEKKRLAESNTSTSSIPSSSSTPSTTSSTRTPSTPRSSSLPSTPSSSSSTRRPRTSSTTSITPERDFVRVPNSVVRDAMPAGIFKGKSKQVWDYLWSISRGAVVPTRKVRKSRKEIQSGAGLGSMVTLDAALVHLESCGLIEVKSSIGSGAGNEYEIFTPEEALTRTPRSSSISSTTRTPGITQNLVDLDQPESGTTRTTQTIEGEGGYAPPNTLSKTFKTIDDEAYIKFRALVARLTGIPAGDLAFDRTLEYLGEVFEQISKRTSVVTDPDALLETHLRREERRQPREVVTKRAVEVETPAPERPFDLESSIKEMRDYLNGGLDIDQFRHGYTGEQWAAITEGVKPYVSRGEARADQDLGTES